MIHLSSICILYLYPISCLHPIPSLRPLWHHPANPSPDGAPHRYISQVDLGECGRLGCGAHHFAQGPGVARLVTVFPFSERSGVLGGPPSSAICDFAGVAHKKLAKSKT